MTFATQYIPPDDESVDPCTDVLVNGESVARIQHCLEGAYVIVVDFYENGEWAGVQHDTVEHPSLESAIAAAKQRFAPDAEEPSL